VGFYVLEKSLYGTSEAEMWGRRYFEVHQWFDWLNSIPLAVTAAMISHGLGAKAWRGLFLGIALHASIDLVCHHEDAHRHFLPFTSWRFHSPVSYWDPNHYGLPFMVFEVMCVAVACMALRRRHRSRLATAGLVAAWIPYLLLGVVLVWWGLLT
jgi:hypothetical protein